MIRPRNELEWTEDSLCAATRDLDVLQNQLFVTT